GHRLQNVASVDRMTNPCGEESLELADAHAVVLGGCAIWKMPDIQEGEVRPCGQLAEPAELAQDEKELGIQTAIMRDDEGVEAAVVAAQEADDVAGRDRVQRHGRQIAEGLPIDRGVGPEPNRYH